MRAVPLLLVLAACVDVADHVDVVRAGFPDHAAVALGDAADPFIATPGGFVTGGVALPVDESGAITMSDASGFTVQVREMRLVGKGVADGGHVRYARDDGSVFWSARGAVVERPRPARRTLGHGRAGQNV